MTRPEEPDLPGRVLPQDAPAFDAPWQAQAFALTVALAEAGHFTWGQWTDALSSRLHGPGAAPDGSDYFDHWLDTLQSLLSDRGLAAQPQVEALTRAWQRAALATPHGQPITLDADPNAL